MIGFCVMICVFVDIQINYNFQVDDSFPSFNGLKANDPDSLDSHDRLDIWWANIFKMRGYATLSKIVKAALSIFSGTQVESSFNTMGDVIDKRSCNMDIATYNAVQNVRSWVECEREDPKNPVPVELFRYYINEKK